MNYEKFDHNVDSFGSDRSIVFQKKNMCYVAPFYLKIIVIILSVVCVIQTTIIITHITKTCPININQNNHELIKNITNQNNISIKIANNFDAVTTNLENITNHIDGMLCGPRFLNFSSGNHTLTPWDYRFSKYITIEMWGSGGAGNSYNGHGGASGGYIKVTIPTFLKTFVLSVGKGGSGNYFETNVQPRCFYSGNFPYASARFGIPNNGTDSIFRSTDLKINIVASSGKWSYVKIPIQFQQNTCFLPTIRQHIENNTMSIPVGSTIHFNIKGNNETFVMNSFFQQYQPGIYNGCDEFPLIYNSYFGYNGGDAPFGGAGGRGTIYVSPNGGTYTSTDGYFPGGGGGGSGVNYDTPIVQYACSPNGGTGNAKGGNGLINIYF